MNDTSSDVFGFYEQAQINHGNLDKYIKLVGDTFLKNILDKNWEIMYQLKITKKRIAWHCSISMT